MALEPQQELMAAPVGMGCCSDSLKDKDIVMPRRNWGALSDKRGLGAPRTPGPWLSVPHSIKLYPDVGSTPQRRPASRSRRQVSEGVEVERTRRGRRSSGGSESVGGTSQAFHHPDCVSSHHFSFPRHSGTQRLSSPPRGWLSPLTDP